MPLPSASFNDIRFSLNFETFSTKAFNMASSDLIEGAAIPSLFIILWSSLLIILSIKFFLKDQK